MKKVYTYSQEQAEGEKRAKNSWHAMHLRCRRPTGKNAKHYYLKGIKVCTQWKSFRQFLLDMGPRPKDMTLDRMDNDKGYEPSNCRWATQEQQVQNRGSLIVQVDIELAAIASLEELCGVPSPGGRIPAARGMAPPRPERTPERADIPTTPQHAQNASPT